jgi:glycosyltransferase involved in cell wall biosynthesis
MRVLYLTYNGLTEALGRRQVLPYVLGLGRRGWQFTVVSFEKPETADGQAQQQVQAELDTVQAAWVPKRYHKRPTLGATAFDVAVGIAAGVQGHGRFDLIHARSTVPALMAAGAARIRRVPWIFDVRGLVAEEYADGGHWPVGGFLFRLTDGAERRLLRGARGLVVLTERIRDEFEQRGEWAPKPTAVIPCAVDLAAFAAPPEARHRVRAALGLGGAPLLTYSGTLSRYRLREMLDFYEVAAEAIAGLSLLILTADGADARSLVTAHPLAQRIRVLGVRPEEVPEYLSAADAGICFLGDQHSKAASSPTKYGEYLAAGLAVITNPWSGDAARLEGNPAWILVKGFSRDDYSVAASDLRRKLEQRERLRVAARALARSSFSLDDALDRYEGLYRRVLEAGP